MSLPLGAARRSRLHSPLLIPRPRGPGSRSSSSAEHQDEHPRRSVRAGAELDRRGMAWSLVELRLSKKMVSPLPKYGIGGLPRIPARVMEKVLEIYWRIDLRRTPRDGEKYLESTLYCTSKYQYLVRCYRTLRGSKGEYLTDYSIGRRQFIADFLKFRRSLILFRWGRVDGPLAHDQKRKYFRRASPVAVSHTQVGGRVGEGWVSEPSKYWNIYWYCLPL